ncbi:MAG: hypothetical protein V1874_05050 [Spirochaetota bacterium]
MENIIVRLQLDGHCIETAAKKEFQHLMDNFMSSQDRDEETSMEQLELLREFLLKSDFRALRASDKRLSGTEKSNVIVFRNSDGKPELQIET